MAPSTAATIAIGQNAEAGNTASGQDNATAVGLFSAIVMGLYRRERTGKGSHVTTSLLAAGIWASGVTVQGALCKAKFYPLHDRTNPPNATLNVYRSSDDKWFLIVVTPDAERTMSTLLGAAGELDADDMQQAAGGQP